MIDPPPPCDPPRILSRSISQIYRSRSRLTSPHLTSCHPSSPPPALFPLVRGCAESLRGSRVEGRGSRRPHSVIDRSTSAAPSKKREPPGPRARAEAAPPWLPPAAGRAPGTLLAHSLACASPVTCHLSPESRRMIPGHTHVHAPVRLFTIHGREVLGEGEARRRSSVIGDRCRPVYISLDGSRPVDGMRPVPEDSFSRSVPDFLLLGRRHVLVQRLVAYFCPSRGSTGARDVAVA